MLSESEILALLDLNKEKAFNALVKTYSRQLYFQINKVLACHEDTNDVLQNCFVKVWKHVSNFKRESKLSTWLYTIAKNETYTFLKKKNKLKSISAEQIEKVFDTLKTDSYINFEVVSKKLKEAIATLPKKQRLVFEMRYFKEMKYAAMAKRIANIRKCAKIFVSLCCKKIESFLKEN